MRTFLALAAAAVVTGPTLAADPPRRTATVDVDGAEVRSGPALGYPAVTQLRKGDSVLLLRDEDKWFFAIEPPPGSVSWVKGIHLAKVELPPGGKANVAVAIEGAEVLAGSDRKSGPTNHITLRLPRGTIVEVTGPSVRVETTNWFPITPPDGDVRWMQKNNIKAASIAAVAPPPTFAPVSGDARTVVTAAPAPTAGLPRDLTSHRLYEQAVRAEQSSDFATAKTLYARIYSDLWEQKAERDAIVICYNRYNRCDEMVKNGGAAPPAATGTSVKRADTTSRSAPTDAKWNGPGYLQELQRVFVEGQPVYSLSDDRGGVAYYVTAADGINLKNYNGKRVQVFGAVQQRPELYRPHITVERIEVK